MCDGKDKFIEAFAKMSPEEKGIAFAYQVMEISDMRDELSKVKKKLRSTTIVIGGELFEVQEQMRSMTILGATVFFTTLVALAIIALAIIGWV